MRHKSIEQAFEQLASNASEWTGDFTGRHEYGDDKYIADVVTGMDLPVTATLEDAQHKLDTEHDQAVETVSAALAERKKLLALVAKFLLCPDLNLASMEQATFELCDEAYELLARAAGVEYPCTVTVLNELATI